MGKIGQIDRHCHTIKLGLGGMGSNLAHHFQFVRVLVSAVECVNHIEILHKRSSECTGI